MQRSYFLIISLFFTATAFSQKKSNPKIDKREIEIALLNFWDNRRGVFSPGRDASGCQFVYRLSWKKDIKMGAGVLIAADYSNGPHHYDFEKVIAYGAAFADITWFIGKRQKWSVGGQAGHGIYKREYKTDDLIEKGFNKWIGGMYYTLSVNYRAIVSKRFLVLVSAFNGFRNFREISVWETYSPPSIDRYKFIEYHSGVGLKLGIIF